MVLRLERMSLPHSVDTFRKVDTMSRMSERTPRRPRRQFDEEFKRKPFV